MSNSLIKITSTEAIFIMIIITINKIILNQPQEIISSMGSSAVLNIIFISIIILFFTFFILKEFKNFSNSDILDISDFVGGKYLRTIIAVFLISYLILNAGLSIRNFSEILSVTYYTQTKIIYIVLFFLLICITTNYFCESSIVKTNVIISVIILFSLIITFFSVSGNYVFQRIYPLLGYGAYNTFLLGLSNILAYNGLIGIYFILPMLSDKNDYKKFTMISVIVVSIIVILSTLCLLLSLSKDLNEDNISPLFSLIAHNKFGNFIQHPEALFVFTWILSIISYVNIIVMFIIYFFRKATGLNGKNIFIIPVCLAILFIALAPKNLIETHNMENFIYSYIGFPLTFIIFPILLILGNIKFKRKDKT